MMAVRQISAHEATVKTATVEIKSLTMSGKQVTLAVFRQLIEEPLLKDLDEETERPILAGHPWGTVNYHPDKCVGDQRHLHVVWQRDDLLRRSHVRWTLPAWSEQWATDIDDMRYLAVVRRILETGGQGSVETVIEGYRYAVRSDGLGATVVEPDRLERTRKLLRSFEPPRYEGALYHEMLGSTWYEDREAVRRAVVEGAGRLVGSQCGGMDAATTWAAANHEQEALSAARSRYRELYAELEALDQLFIAV